MNKTYPALAALALAFCATTASASATTIWSCVAVTAICTKEKTAASCAASTTT